MKRKFKKNETTLDDKEISQDFFEVFDKSDAFDLSKSFIEARAKHGLTQEMVARTLKVRTSSIRKFENGEDLDISGSAYKIGFLRSYAKLVGLDGDFVVKTYKKLNIINDEPVDYNFPTAVKEKKSFLPLFSLIVFLFAMISYSSWYYVNITEDKVSISQVTDSKTYQNKFNYVKIEQDKISSENSLSEDKILNENNVTIEDEINIVNNQFEDIETNSNPLKDEIITNEVSAVANERDPDTEMVLKSFGNSWVEIEDVDGNSFLTRLMRPGETFVIPKQKGLTLSTGNAGVLSLTYGSVYISSLGDVGEVISSRPLNIEAFKNR